MSRYLLIPKVDRNSDEDQLALLPMEKFTDQIRTIEVSKGILVPLPVQMNSDMARALLIKLSKSGLGRSKDGFLIAGSKVTNIKFDNAIKDICRGNFSELYEEFYCILRRHGITF